MVAHAVRGATHQCAKYALLRLPTRGPSARRPGTGVLALRARRELVGKAFGESSRLCDVVPRQRVEFGGQIAGVRLQTNAGSAATSKTMSRRMRELPAALNNHEDVHRSYGRGENACVGGSFRPSAPRHLPYPAIRYRDPG